MIFTFTLRLNAGYAEAQEMVFDDDAAAIQGARSILQVTIDKRTPYSEVVVCATIGVGRGAPKSSTIRSGHDGKWELTLMGEPARARG